MVGKPGKTAIHEAGLALLVTVLLEMGWPAVKIIRYVKMFHDTILGFDQIRWFREHFVEEMTEDDRARLEEAKKRIGDDQTAEMGRFDVAYERQKYANILGTTIEILVESEMAKGEMAFHGADKLREVRLLIDQGSKVLDPVKRDLFDTGRLESATSEPGAGQNIQIESMNVVQALVQNAGIDEDAAVNAVLLATYGPHRLGYSESPVIRDKPLDDQRREVLAGGACVSEGVVCEEVSGGSVQESDPSGSE